jgi:DNA-binding Lrp family transcriptional regulator
MSLRAMLWVFDHSPSQLGARLVLLALAEYAHDDGTKAFPTVATIAAKTRLSERSVQNALKRLQEDGEIERTTETKAGVNVYRIIGMEGVQNLHPGGAIYDGEGVQNLHPTQEQDPSLTREYEVVRTAWKSHSPPLANHRHTYLVSDKTRDAIKAALKVYDADSIAEAVANYATVLGGDDYRWDYSWTLRDFLARGLDRFVPEARPLENFRQRDARRSSRHDFSDLA